MKLEIKFDDKKVMAKLRNLEKTTPKKIDTAIAKTATFAINIIQQNMDRGQGISGPFKPYSESYAKFRADKGRQVSPVDLTFTGKMRAAMAHRALGTGRQRLYFLDALSSKKAFHNNKTRPFFGFNAQDRSRLTEFFRRSLQL